MPSQLELRGVTVTYGDVIAAQDVSLALEEGQIGCLLGPSGCGKSTLLRAIGGFEPLAAGEIALCGEVISRAGFTLEPERRKVGMVFQDFALFPHLDVAGNIGFGLRALPTADRRRRVDALLALVGLERWSRSYPHELSGGQQQRVALARALAPRPGLLLLDEPFSNLDADLREQLAAEVRELLRRDRVTAVVVTHDQNEAFAMADHIALLREGRVAQADSAYNLYHHPASEFVAEFIGQGEIVAARLAESGALEHGLGRLDRTHPQWRPGATLKVLVRPADVTYDSASSLRLQVTGRWFRGAEFLYHLALPDGQKIPCLAPANVAIDVGAEMPVSFDLREPIILPPER